MKRMHSNVVAVLILATCLVGCGGQFVPQPADGVLQSAVVLTSAPEIQSIEIWLDQGLAFRAEYDSTDIQIVGADVTTPLTVPGAGILWLGMIEKSSTRYLLVGAIDASDAYSMHRFHDTSGDGVPDNSTRVELWDSAPSKLYITDVSILDGGDFYMLDRRCQDVVIATDTDSDGWVDDASTIFAMSDDHPELLERYHLGVSEEAGEIQVIVSASPVVARSTAPTMRDYTSYVKLTDTDSDGDADVVATVERRSTHPFVMAPVVAGQTSIPVRGIFDLAGRSVEIWKLDNSGNDLSELGSSALDTTGYADVALSTGPGLDLVEGDVLSARFDDAAAGEHVLVTVARDGPYTTSVDPATITDPTVANALTIHGVGFVSGMEVYYLRQGINVDPVSMTFTLVSSTEVSVTLPAFSDWGDTEGVLHIFVKMPADERPIAVQTVHVECDEGE